MNFSRILIWIEADQRQAHSTPNFTLIVLDISMHAHAQQLWQPFRFRLCWQLQQKTTTRDCIACQTKHSFDSSIHWIEFKIYFSRLYCSDAVGVVNRMPLKKLRSRSQRQKYDSIHKMLSIAQHDQKCPFEWHTPKTTTKTTTETLKHLKRNSFIAFTVRPLAK